MIPGLEGVAEELGKRGGLEDDRALRPTVCEARRGSALRTYAAGRSKLATD
jgi:hypothetical protein